MWHILLASAHPLDPRVLDELRRVAPPSVVFLSVEGLDATLDLLARSSRLDGVITWDRAVEESIRAEIPGTLPVLVVAGDPDAEGIWSRFEHALAGDSET